jgi:hypothetical protein
VIAGVAIGAPNPSTAQGEKAVSSFELSPGVVVDSNRGEVYVMSPEGGIVAVDLAKGAEVWRSKDAAKPLALAGEVLIGQAEASGSDNDLRIVGLHTGQLGQPVTESRVALPPNVHPMIAETAGRSFVAQAQPQAGETTLSWQFVEQPLRGIPPGPTQVLPGETPPGVSAMAPPLGMAMSMASTVVMPGPAEPGGEPTVIRGSAQIDTNSGAVKSVTAPQFAAASTTAADAPSSLSTPAAPAALPGVPEPQFLSADERHVLSSRRVADDPEWDKYLWTIFDRQTAQPVGEFRAHVRYAPFFVVDSHVVYQTGPYARRVGGTMVQEPLQIRATDISTGQQLWSRPVRDTRSTLPPPP